MIRELITQNKKARALLWLGFAVYVAFILKITVFRSGFGTHPLFSGEINWAVMKNYFLILGRGYPGVAAYYFFGNIGVFIPFGVFDAVLLRHSFPRCAFDGFLFSLIIEIMQYVFGTGLTEVDDLILNTAGVVIGYAAASLLLKKK